MTKLAMKLLIQNCTHLKDITIPCNPFDNDNSRHKNVTYKLKDINTPSAEKDHLKDDGNK